MALPTHFFFYGTLSEGMDNPVIAAIRPKLGPGKPASVSGRLFAIPEREGWYPALTPGDGRVMGYLYSVTPAFTSDDLAALDRYEAFDPDRPEASEYVRGPMRITADGEKIVADVYRYAAKLPETARLIAEPSFAAFLATNGLRALAPRD